MNFSTLIGCSTMPKGSPKKRTAERTLAAAACLILDMSSMMIVWSTKQGCGPLAMARVPRKRESARAGLMLPSGAMNLTESMIEGEALCSEDKCWEVNARRSDIFENQPGVLQGPKRPPIGKMKSVSKT